MVDPKGDKRSVALGRANSPGERHGWALPRKYGGDQDPTEDRGDEYARSYSMAQLTHHPKNLFVKTNGSKRGETLPNTPDSSRSSRSVGTPQSALQPLYGDPDEEVFNKWNFSPF